MRKRIVIDWSMVIGFGGLLLLVVAIGVIGVQQIDGLSQVVGQLAKNDMPLQNAIAEMKSSNHKFAIGIRNYIFWRNAKYLDAAAMAGKLNLVNSALDNFKKHLAFYTSRVSAPPQQEWVEAIRRDQNQLRLIGKNIMVLVDKIEMADAAAKRSLSDSLNRQLMDFEQTLFKIDSFLDNPVQEFNRRQISERLTNAEAGRRHAVFFLDISLLICLWLGIQTAVFVYLRSKKEKERRELLWRKVIRVEEEEKNNLSLQIHDQMGQDLSGLKIYLGLIGQDLPKDTKELHEKIEKTKKILDMLIVKAHNISEMLRPPELDELGLTESIAALVEHYKEMTGCHYNYRRPSFEIQLPPEKSLVLYRVIQEALTNIAKHAQAKNIDISIEKKDDTVSLVVSDDGAGFDYDTSDQSLRRRKEDKLKLGLQGLRERIELYGGRLNVDTQPGEGTRLFVTLPVA